MPQNGTWFSYSLSAKLILAIVLLTVAGALAIAGTKLPLPARLPRPGKNGTTLMVVAWALSITAFLACVGIYATAGVTFSPLPSPASQAARLRR